MRRRVVVTGLAIRGPLGDSTDEFWSAAQAGESGARSVDIPGVGTVTTCPVNDPDADALFGRRDARRMDRVGALAAAVAREALEAAGALGLPAEQIGASIGCAHGGVTTLEEAFAVANERGIDRFSPLSLPLWIPNSAAAAVARACELRGPSAAMTTACAAGSDAIAHAIAAIRDGRADAMVAGGAEAAITPMTVAGYLRLGALSVGDRPAAETSRPFDRGRDGFVIGEGAGMLVLEEREHALARGAEPLAELTGYGNSCDAGHITDPDPAGAGPARAIAHALADAGREPAEVDHVNAHATSTPSGDLAELHALDSVGVGSARVSATKSMHGHLLGAAGGVEAALVILALRDGVVPPTINLTDPEPDPALNHVTAADTSRPMVAISNSFGFGGHNCCLVIEAPEAAATA